MPKKLVNIEKNNNIEQNNDIDQNTDILIENTPEDDENNNKKEVVEKKMGRPSKNNAVYDKLRENVVQKFFEIIEMPNRNGVISVDEIDKKTSEILLFVDEIKIAFNYSHYPYFKKNNVSNTSCLSLVKSILKDMDYVVKTHTEYFTCNKVRTGKKMLSIYKEK